VRLSANAEAGSEINIVADQVKINDINFVSNGGSATNNTGYVESNNYSAGVSGWRIGGTGNAEFSNVVVRGEIVATSGSLGDLDVDGTLTIGVLGLLDWTGGRISNFGVELESGGSYSQGAGIEWPTAGAKIYVLTDTGVNTLYVESNGPMVLNSGSFTVRIDETGKLSILNNTDSTSSTTGAITTAGGVGIAKNLHVGGTGNFTNVVTVPNATADTHALNRQTGDGRYYPLNGIQDDGAGAFNPNTNLTINIGGTLYKVQAEQL
jgi:hypothetical protein